MTSEKRDVAVLLTCHGTVEDVADIPAFVRNIRRGRPAPDDVIAEVTRRFEAIGGSPLMRITAQQAAALEERLGIIVRSAGRLWGPYPEEVVKPLLEGGIKRVVSLPLAPQSVHVYNDFVEERLAPFGVELTRAPSYGLEPDLIAAFVEAIEEGLAELESTEADPAVILTAHSLPIRVIAAGDPYQQQFEAMAYGVRDALVPRASLSTDSVIVAYQSQGMGGGDWLGPNLEEALLRAMSAGHESVLVAPIGFVAEHVETLYDIDIEARGLAETMGFTQLVRMPPMNTRPRFIDALATTAARLL